MQSQDISVFSSVHYQCILNILYVKTCEHEDIINTGRFVLPLLVLSPGSLQDSFITLYYLAALVMTVLKPRNMLAC